MRYEDASGTDSFSANEAAQSSTLSAHNDADVILAGKFGPATGNAITGAGTVSGSAGADSIASGHAAITAIQGAGGTDTTFSGGHLQIAGQYGVLTMDAQGNYSYVRNHGTPNGVSDVFNYTLSANDGATDIATLTINIGKTPTVIQANAVQVVPGPNGVVTLPAGVELSDIHVVGRNLVIDMPDGTQMIIVDGAVFVPQLVLGTVEVPSTNLAALLIDSEPQPAAGPPQSSGGNFEVPVPPLDPGEPLGDLIPPTELNFPPIDVVEVVNAEVEDDNIVLITDLTPSVSGGDVIVDEDDLPAGSDTTKESLTSGGTFTISAPDGVEDLTVGSLNVIVDGVFQAGASMTTPLGNVLTITGYNAATGVISYTYTLGAAETHATGAGENSLFEDFLVTLTDTDGDVDTDTLSANIIDDIPTANNDVAGLLEGGATSVTVDVDTNDVPGADGTASRVFASLTGTYGNLVLNGDGTQTYTLNAAGITAINALPPGATLSDTFNYTLTDGDGDADPATLVVTLTGADDPPLIFNLTPHAGGGEAIVDEDDLADGSDTSKESLTVSGSFNISAPDGIDDLTVGGIQVIINGVFQAGATGLSPLGNQVTFTGFNPATGEISVSYTLLDNETHASGLGENNLLGQLFDDMTVTLSDTDGDIATDTLSVQIIDDVPTANDDAFTILEGDADNAISFDVDLNDVPGADGTASRTFTTLIGTYGTITLNGDGTQTYTLNATGIAAINGLAGGATLTDTFNYTLTDTDGDSDPAQVVITLTGVDDPVLITGLTPAANGGDAIVDEDDLADGSDTSKESLTTTGDFTISAPDGVDDLTVGGFNVIVNGVFQAGSHVTPLGNTLTFISYNAATGVISYSYTLLDNEAHANANGENSLFENFAVTLTDTDGSSDTDTLSVNIVDDVPTANDDAFTIFEGDADNAITFDVDTNDVPGADGTASRIFTSLVGTYGNLVVNGDGTQTYTLNATGIAAIGALAPGATLTDNFSYTLTDGDGDTDPANLVITLQGTDDPPIITGLNPAAQGGDAIVDEDDLADGSDTSKESLTTNGDFTISAPDGVNDLTVGGFNVIIDGVFQAGSHVTPLGNTLTFISYNAATGVISYSYTLLDNETHPNANGQNSIFEDFAVSLTDTDNDVATDTLSVQIVDDVPTANDDAFTIFEGDADNAITFDVDTNDVPGADGTASRIFTSLVGTYGNLVVNGDGTQTYTLNATGIAALNALAPGATLTDNFSYTLTDGDGDTDPANLVITLTGTDDPPEITNLTPKAQGGDAIVDEDDLADGSDTSKESLTTNGDFTISAPDGVNDLTVGGFNVIIDGVFQAGSHVTPLGNTLTFISYNAATGVVSYSYTLLDNETHPNANGQNSIFEDFAVSLTDTDNDVATDTLSVQIVDDVPTANDDAFTIFEGDADNAITFDVDTNDVPGADGTASRIFTSLVGTYGNLVVNGDGTQTYTLNATGIAALNALAPGATLNDNFSYTLTDGDGDTDPANLVITLQGTDDPPTITGLNPKTNGGDAIVDEDDLADGSDTSKESLTATGDFTITAPDGVNDLTVGGFNVIIDGVFQAGSHVTPLGNTLTFISYNAATGVISYSYTLLDNETHPNANGQNSIFEDFAVVLTDTDNDVANDTLSVQIVDDVPTANDDAFTIFEGDADNAITFDVDTNDVPGADGTASRIFTSLVGTYGNIVVNGDGTQTYTLNAAGIIALNALSNGATLTDNFSYTLTDGDGDSDPANLVITLQGTDDPVLITNLTPSANGGDAIVDEDDLVPDGSDPTKESVTVTGNFTISAPDGVDDLTVGGVQVIINGVFQAGANGATPLGNTITFTGYNAGTGVISYSYTLLDNETHANANGENSLFDDMLVTLTDVDGDSDTDTLSVQIVDDVPTAVNDTVGQVGENNPVIINAFANDTFGADGVDTDNAPVVKVTFTQPPVGQGTVSYNPATGQFTFTPAAGQAGSTSFTYTITDGDGDPSTATVTINLLPDSTPQVTNGVAAVDDDGLTGGNAASVTGDLDANAGEAAPVNPSEAIFHGQLVASGGGDTITAYSFAAMGGTSGTVGTETVNYAWNAGTNTLTATGPRGVLFNVVVNPTTGSYNLTLVDNVLHAVVAGENDATTNLTFTVTDSDGDSANGTIVVTFDDDAPSNFSPVDLIDTTNATVTTQDNALVNDGTANVTRLINDANNDGVGENFMGADGFGSLTFSGGTNGAQLQSDGGTPLTSGGLAIFVFGYGTGTLTATTDVTNTNPASVVFTATLNPGAGFGSASTYTIDFNHAIDDGSGFVFDDFSTAPAGQNVWIGLDSDGNSINVDNNDSQDILITGTAGGSVNTSSSDIGSNNQWIDGGEGIRVDFVVDVRTGTGNEKTALGYTFDSHYTVTDGAFTVMQGGPAAVRIQAVLDPDTGDIRTLGGPNVQIDASSIVVTNGGVVVPPAGYTVFNMGDGSFVITGLDQGDNVAFDTNGAAFNAMLITSADGVLNTTTPAPGDTFSGSHFSVGEFGFSSAQQGDPLDITLGLTATDADGDTATGTIDITLVPAAVPVVVDMDGDGVEFLGQNAGVHYDYAGDGHAEATGWVGADDAILVRDANGNGTVDNASEFVFGGNGQTDLQALAAQYGSTLDANDADFGKFAVWQDANSNGVADAGEVTSLTDAGINSISLSSDGIAYEAAGGDVQVAGTGSFTRADGSSGQLADAIFLTDSQRNAANTNTALIAALAAAGVAATPAAAHHADLSSASTVAIAAAIVSSNASAISGNDDNSQSAIGGDANQASGDDVSQPVASSSSSGDEQSSDHSLTSANDASPASAPTELLEATDASSQPVADNFVAATVAMPSAQALAAATSQDNSSEGAQSSAVVGKVLVDALHGGGAEQSIDALLAALPGHGNGANAAADALASQPVAAVPAWDTGHMAAFTGHANFTMEAVALHHDAVQPVANG